MVLTDHGVEHTDTPHLRPEELIDSVLAATESCLAPYVALSAAAELRGQTVVDSHEFLTRLGLSPPTEGSSLRPSEATAGRGVVPLS